MHGYFVPAPISSTTCRSISRTLPGKLRVVDRLHRGDGIDRGDLHLSAFTLLHDHVAGQHGADLVLRLQGPVGHLRIAGAKDAVGAEIHVELLLQRGLHINVAQHTETVALQRFGGRADGGIKGKADCGGEVIDHGESPSENERSN